MEQDARVRVNKEIPIFRGQFGVITSIHDVNEDMRFAVRLDGNEHTIWFAEYELEVI